MFVCVQRFFNGVWTLKISFVVIALILLSGVWTLNNIIMVVNYTHSW